MFPPVVLQTSDIILWYGTIKEYEIEMKSVRLLENKSLLSSCEIECTFRVYKGLLWLRSYW
jgi:hypothetical protein